MYMRSLRRTISVNSAGTFSTALPENLPFSKMRLSP